MTRSFSPQRLLPLFLLALLILGTTTACAAANLVVLNTGDSGAGSLRQAILDSSSGDTISFDSAVTGTITLTGGALTIGHTLTVTGPGASALSIDAGGASRLFNITAGTVQFSGLTLTHGHSSGHGGAVINSGTLTVASCAITNSSGQYGGGISNETNGVLTLSGDTFTNNSATFSGGGFFNASGTTTSSVTNCTFSGNSATYGGGILNVAVLTVTNCTFSSNTGSSSNTGGLYAAGATTITACLFVGSINGDLQGAVTSGGSNLLGDGDGNGVVNGTNHDQTGVSAGTANLGALASNGGPTQTCAVLMGSPAIGGDYALATSLDQRGYVRTAAQHTIGAYEANATLPVTVTALAITPSPVSLAVGTPQQLTATATYSDSSTADVTSQATWTTLNPTVLTIDATGLATPNAPGLTLASATFGGLTATANVTVTNPSAATGYDALWTRTDGEFSVWEVTQSGNFSNNDFDAVPNFTAQSFAMTPDGHAHILLTASDGTISLDDALVSAQPNSHKTGTLTQYGPYPGWTAQAVAAGPNGRLRILWAGTGGSMALWKVFANGSYSHTEYGPYAGWTPIALAVAPDNTLRVLWTNTDGRVSFWVVDSIGNFQHFEYGPFPGWTPSALATGPDGLSHITWNQAGDGSVALWTLDDTGRFVPIMLGAYSGWQSAGLTIGADDTLHVGWAGTGGTASLWAMPDTAPLTFTHTEYGPFLDTGWSLHALATAP